MGKGVIMGGMGAGDPRIRATAIESGSGHITSFSGDYRFLSNFYPCQIQTADGEIWPTLEHAYQSLKCPLPAYKQAIHVCPTPGSAKQRGGARSLPASDLVHNWDQLRVPIMYGLLQAKFTAQPCKLWLLATNDRELVEGNTWGDVFWGMVKSKGEWIGENWLGELLMLVRRELQYKLV